MDKPRFDHCENYCYGPEGHYCLLWKSNLKNCCYSDSVCDAQNILEKDDMAKDLERFTGLQHGRY